MKQIALSLFVIASSGAYVLDKPGDGPAGEIIDTAGSANTAEINVLHPGGPVPAAAAAAVLPAWSAPAINQPGERIEPHATRPGPSGSEPKTAIATPIPEASKSPVAEVHTLAVSGPRASETPIPPPKLTPPQFVDDAPLQAASFAITPAVYIPVPQPRPNYPQAPTLVIKAGMKLVHSFADGTFTGPVTDAYYGLIQIQASIQGGRLISLKVLKYPSDRRTSININRQALPMLRDEAITAQSANVDIISGATLTSRAFRQSLAGALKQASS
ncbi:FMN-binding protein [Mesorhizobium loti]|nr:FMN-binding protein [Mesorhizobium loti]